MSFSVATGTLINPAVSTTTFTLVPHASGNFIILEILAGFSAGSTTSYATALSSASGDVTWSVLVAHHAFTNNPGVSTVFIGNVVTASSHTVTITFNTGTPTVRVAGLEFSNTGGFGAVTLDASGTVDLASNGTMPSVSPTKTGDLYCGYVYNNGGSPVVGSTSGFTYFLDANGNQFAYRLSCTNSAQTPNIGDSNGTSGTGVMLYEAGVTANAGLATATGAAQPPVAAAGATASAAAGTGAALAVGAGYTPAVASAAGTALQPSVTTSGNRTVLPGTAAATGTAQPPVAKVTAVAGLAAAAGTALPVVFYTTSPAVVASRFGTFPQVPVNSAILSVIANVTQHGSDAAIAAPLYELWDGTTARIGIAQPGTASTAVSNVDSVVFTGASWAQLATLQLRVYARSAQPGNSGATVSVDAVSLSVEWSLATSVVINPNVRKGTTAFPAPVVTVGRTVLPAVLAVVPTLPAVTTGTFTPGLITPITLAAATALPAPAAGAGITVFPGVLARVPAFPPVTDVTAPGYATAESVLAGGSGSWGNPGNITGAPDGNYGVWTVP